MTRLRHASVPALIAATALLAACGDDAAPAASGDAAAPAAPADSAQAWTVDHSASTLTVTGDYGANPFTGTFEDWSANIAFAPDDLANSSIEVAVQVGSFESGDGSRDDAAVSSRWLDADGFPTATFESTEIVESGDGYIARGVFTVVGASNPMDLEFDVEIDGDTAHATGGVTFDHHDYAITGGYDDPDTGDLFAVAFDITATAAE
jgi:polyisoprenoid-binding protein YceI